MVITKEEVFLQHRDAELPRSLESIGPWYWPPFSPAELEEQYWQRHRGSDLSRATILIAAVMVSFAVFATSDYRFFGASAQLAWLAVARVLALLACVVALVQFRRRPTCWNVRWTLFIWSLATSAISAYICTTRPSDYVGYSILNLTFIFAGYLMVPSTWVLLAIPGVLISALYVILAVLAAPHQQIAHVAMIASFLFANILGSVFAFQLETWKRRQFLALRQETDLRLRLQAAMTEIKTLQGILPICSHCKRIRDEAGDWYEVEVYVRDRTDAEFSHGICPRCFQVHYHDCLDEPPQDPAANAS